MIARIHRRFAGLGRDSKGASVIELALIAPVLGVVLMGVIDVAMGYSRTLVLEQAAYRSLEKVAVGTIQSDYSYVQTEAQAALTAAGVTGATVVVDTWLECNRVRQTDFNGVCPEGEMISRYVKVTITSNYQARFAYGPLGSAFGANSSGAIPITANASLRIQ